MSPSIALIIAAITLLGILCQWVAWRVRLPAILFLLLAGLGIGPVAGWLQPDAVFGDLLFPFVSLAVAVILFEGSLTLRFSDIAGLQRVVRRMVSSGVLITWAVVALATHFLAGFPVPLAVLFGALTTVTGPTVIVPMLRTVRPNARIASILRWEGIVIDPVGALLAVLVFEFIVSEQLGGALGHTLLSFGRMLLIGLVFGLAGGELMGQAIRRHWIPDYLRNVSVLAAVFILFALSNELQHEAGLLTVTVMGIRMANMKGLAVEGILDFKESLSILLISVLFIVLAARVDLASLQLVGWGALGVLAIMQFVARPLKVLFATRGSDLEWREKALLAWIAPRGIVAAAVAALFALRLEELGMPGAELLVPLTFSIILGTVVLQSATARPLARLLGVAEPEPRGFLIVGADPVARTIGKALAAQGYQVLLCDDNWNHIRAARMHGLPTFYGNPVSEVADRRLDLVGLGRLLALSPRQELNLLALQRYRREFGEEALYVLLNEADGDEARILPRPELGRVLFGEEVTHRRLSDMLARGAEVRETRLTEVHDFNDYLMTHSAGAVPLFALDPKGRLRLFTAGERIEPGPSWTLVSLVEPAAGAEGIEQAEPSEGEAAGAAEKG